MILLHNIVAIRNLADADRGAVLLVIALDGRFIGRAAINGDLLRHAVAADRLGQEAFGRLLVALLREEEINRLAVFIDSAIEIAPLALDLNVGLVHPPADPHRSLATVQGFFEERAVFDHPPVNGRVIHVDPTLCQSGSREGLLPPSPLRTARTSFPVGRSSLSNALLRTR